MRFCPIQRCLPLESVASFPAFGGDYGFRSLACKEAGLVTYIKSTLFSFVQFP